MPDNKWRARARQVAQQNGVDPDIFDRLVTQESGYNTDAVSGAGAIGLTQLMPATARGLGVDPTDPEQNLQGGARFLRSMLDRYGGDYRLALAAYNAGPGAVDRHGDVPPSEETRRYVETILPSSDAAPTPDQFGTDQGLTSQEAYAACGPAAAVAFARANGRNPTLREALDMAKTVGWTAEGGMNGVANQKRLLDKMGIPATLDTTANWQRIQDEALAGHPVTISTPLHYFIADGYDGQRGYHVGQSGLALKNGSAWMTQQQIEDRAGAVNGALYMQGGTDTGKVRGLSSPMGDVQMADGTGNAQIDALIEKHGPVTAGKGIVVDEYIPDPTKPAGSPFIKNPNPTERWELEDGTFLTVRGGATGSPQLAGFKEAKPPATKAPPATKPTPFPHPPPAGRTQAQEALAQAATALAQARVARANAQTGIEQQKADGQIAYWKARADRLDKLSDADLAKEKALTDADLAKAGLADVRAADITAKTQPQIDALHAAAARSLAAAGHSNAQIAQILALTPARVAQITANIGLTTARTGLTEAQTAKVQAGIEPQLAALDQFNDIISQLEQQVKDPTSPLYGKYDQANAMATQAKANLDAYQRGATVFQEQQEAARQAEAKATMGSAFLQHRLSTGSTLASALVNAVLSGAANAATPKGGQHVGFDPTALVPGMLDTYQGGAQMTDFARQLMMLAKGPPAIAAQTPWLIPDTTDAKAALPVTAASPLDTPAQPGQTPTTDRSLQQPPKLPIPGAGGDVGETPPLQSAETVNAWLASQQNAAGRDVAIPAGR